MPTEEFLPPLPPRRPTPEIAAWNNNTQDVAAEQAILAQEAARRRIAHISSGTTAPIPPLTSESKLTVDAIVARATIPIVPTLYPGELSGAIIVHNQITININGVAGQEFLAKMSELLTHLQQSNEIPGGEVKEKLVAELTAGTAILKSPKPDRDLIELFLKRPLMYIGEKTAGTVIGKLAIAMLELLGKLTGLWW